MENKDSQEIDLNDVFKKVKEFFKSLIIGFFKFINYIKSNIIKITVIFIVGIVLGYLIDKSSKSYNQEIMVMPNAQSVDYLYKRLDLLNSLFKEKDTSFLYKKGFRDIRKIGEIKIEPIVDIFKFVESYKDSNSNFDMIKLMAEDGDLNKIIENEVLSKNYRYHLISFTSSKKLNPKSINETLMNFLNESEFFQKVLNQEIQNNQTRIKQNDSIIKQIDVILESFKSTSKSSSLVYYNENLQLNDIITTKNNLVNENGFLKVELINKDKIIKDISYTLNMRDTSGINGKMKFFLPFLFVFMFLVITGFYKTYKKYSI